MPSHSRCSEAVAGIMYPAVLIGRLIGLSQTNASQGEK
jgi:hypothetical protein